MALRLNLGIAPPFTVMVLFVVMGLLSVWLFDTKSIAWEWVECQY